MENERIKEDEIPSNREILEMLVSGFDRLELRFDRSEERQEAFRREVAGEFSEVKRDIADLKSDVKRLDGKIDTVAETLTGIVEDHEARITALEGAKG